MVRIALGLLLLTAAGLKAHQLATEPLLGTGLLDSRWLLMAAVEFELLLGLCLMANLWPKPTWAIALTCFALFTCVSLYKALSGHATCGCFGRVPVNPWYTATLDLTAILSFLCWRPAGQKLLLGTNSDRLSFRVMAMLAVWPAVGIPAAFAMSSFSPARLSDAGEIIGNGQVVILKPESWIGKRFPLLDCIDIGDKLRDGNWLVVLYHHDCAKCRQTIRDLQPLTRELRVQQVALVEMPPYWSSSRAPTLDGVVLVCGRLTDAREWFAETPILVSLLRGRIAACLSPAGTQRDGMVHSLP